MTKTMAFDEAALLDTPAQRAAYLQDILDTGNEELIAHAMGVVLRAEGMSAVAEAADISRANLYKSFDHGRNPGFLTVQKTLRAAGLALRVEPIRPKDPA
ncbi:MAG: addiction module antidote protein [Pacificimonas sp.]|jgi:probable addiction module antidote protein|nr:addiction module antidote protein [Pacificimonas sp.]